MRGGEVAGSENWAGSLVGPRAERAGPGEWLVVGTRCLAWAVEPGSGPLVSKARHGACVEVKGRGVPGEVGRARVTSRGPGGPEEKPSIGGLDGPVHVKS